MAGDVCTSSSTRQDGSPTVLRIGRPFARRPRRIQRRIEAAAEDEFLVLKELRLDAVPTMIPQLAAKPIVAAEEFKQLLARLRSAGRGPWCVVAQGLLVFRRGIAHASTVQPSRLSSATSRSYCCRNSSMCVRVATMTVR